MARNPEDSFYVEPDDFLQQGDIFQVDIVAPAADETQRIFRTKDGRHGSIVFAENIEGKVFDRPELESLLATTTKTSLHTLPFHQTSDGQEEMVVVFSRLYRFFIIATQTCDICGKDKAQHLWATVLPVITVRDLCRTEPFPWSSTHEISPIHEFVTRNCPEAVGLESVTDFDYVPRLKSILNDPTKLPSDKKVLQDLSHIKNYLKNYYKKLYMFSLPANSRFHLPESYVDFTSAFTVHTAKLLAIQSARFVTIADPYRIDFARKFGEFFARLALPRPMSPD